MLGKLGIREGEKANPLAELQKAALPLDRAIDAAVETMNSSTRRFCSRQAEFLGQHCSVFGRVAKRP